MTACPNCKSAAESSVVDGERVWFCHDCGWRATDLSPTYTLWEWEALHPWTLSGHARDERWEIRGFAEWAQDQPYYVDARLTKAEWHHAFMQYLDNMGHCLKHWSEQADGCPRCVEDVENEAADAAFNAMVDNGEWE